MFTLTPLGPFALAESAGFAFVDRESGPREPRMRLAFCCDRDWEPTGALVTQDGAGVRVQAGAGVRGQLERILGLDVDANGFAEVGRRDPVIGRLQAGAHGLRPPLIPSAYEAAVFCILAARRSAAQARAIRVRLAEQAGTVLDVGGERVVCLPPPAALVAARPVAGVDPVRQERLRAVARAALDGRLDTDALRAMNPADARTHLESLPGIGPFSSAVIVVRSLGHTDVMFGTLTELNEKVGRLYDLGHPATPAELGRIADGWSPWRTWSQLYVRAVSDRLVAA